MTAILLKGRTVAKKLLLDIQERASAITTQRGTPPHLAILAIGGNASSRIFLNRELEMCKNAGIECTVEALPEAISEHETLKIVKRLGLDINIDGIILDLPIPKSLHAGRVTDAIPPEKDVEGLTTANFGRLFQENSFSRIKQSDIMLPCTAIATIQLLLETGCDPRGMNAVVIGRSNIVGKPIAHLLSCLDTTVTLCHSRTRNLQTVVRNADIVVGAVGKPRFIRRDWIKPGAIVLDAGMYSKGATVCGDVDFDEVKGVAGYITPVPGGIGPLTVTFLLYNTVISAEHRTRRILEN